MIIATRTSASLATLALLAGAEAALGQDPEAPQDTAASSTEAITIVLTEFDIEMPDTVAAGETRFSVTNYGTVEHSFALGKVKPAEGRGDGVAARQGDETRTARSHGNRDRGTAGAGQDGPGPEAELERNLLPGENATLTVDLEPGAYRIWCPVDHHAEEGMSRILQVVQEKAVSS